MIGVVFCESLKAPNKSKGGDSMNFSPSSLLDNVVPLGRLGFLAQV
jgi:hypothetical protein